MSKCHQNDGLGLGVPACPMGGCRWQARVGSLHINFIFEVYIKMVEMIDWKEACDTFMFCSAAFLSANVRTVQSSLWN